MGTKTDKLSIGRLKPAFTPDCTSPATPPRHGRPPQVKSAVNDHFFSPSPATPPVISPPSSAPPVLSPPPVAAAEQKTLRSGRLYFLSSK